MKILAALDPDLGQLVKLLKRARDQYYNTGEFYKAEPVELVAGPSRSILRETKGLVTDAVYDKLEDRLRELDPDHPLLKAVGVAPKKRKIRLPFRMPSLNKIKGVAVAPWLDQHEGPYVVSDKVDGVSIGVEYSGKNRLAFTRGDGQTGGDISFMAADLGLPELKTSLKVRGEIVMPVAKFNALWAEHFANPRNMVSGITNRNSLHEALKHCRVYMYELVEPRMRPSAALQKLKQLGFRTVPHVVVDTLTIDKLVKMLERRRTVAQYEMDGLVVQQDKKTTASTSNPDHSVAFKDEASDDMAVATVVEVEWRTTRTGALFPRVIIEPVRLKGVTVTYCSGKSGMTIKNLGIGPGAKIKIARSGDVIPDIREVVKAVRWQQPNKELGEWRWNGDNIVLVDHTSNEGTSNDVAVQQMSFFFTTIGVERFKAATLQKFIDAGIQDVASVLKMTQAQFLRVPGTSEKVLTGVWQQLQASIAEIELHVLMYASGVFGRNFGSKRFAAILKAIPDVLDFGEGKTALVEAVDAVEGFDLVTAKQFATQLPAFRRWLKTVPSVKYITPRKTKQTGKRCANQRVVMTGFRDADLKLQIEQQGGEVIDSIKKATVLLAKDPSGASTKLDTARQLRIPIMTAEQFRKKFF